jgi:S-adenosylmethionine hydrolase
METAVLICDYGADSPHKEAARHALERSGLFTNVIVLTSSIKPFQVNDAGYVCSLFLNQFEPGTTFIIAVNFLKRHEHQAIVQSRIGTQNLISYNSGIQHLVAGNLNLESKCIGHFEDDHNYFVQKGILPALNAEQNPLDEKINELFQQQPILDSKSVLGHVLYIDAHGNAHTNISKSILAPYLKKPFEIRLSRHEKTTSILPHPDHVSLGQIACSFNEANKLAIYCKGGSAAQLLGLKASRIIEIESI